MIAYDVPLLYHSGDNIGSGFQLINRAEERRLDIFLLENVKYLVSVAVVVSAVKGQIDCLVLSFCIVGHGFVILGLKEFFRIHGNLMRLAVLCHSVGMFDPVGRQSP